MLKKSVSLIIASTMSLLLLGTSALADTPEEKRAKIREMRQDVLTELFETRPQANAEIDEAVGYAVFKNVGINVVLFAAEGGRGVAYDNASGKETFMKMGSAGVGIGLGLKDFRAVFIFHDRGAFDSFVNKGWDLSGEVDAAARADDVGGEIGEAASVRKKVSIYQFTKNGLVLQATIQGTKYWKDKKLNKGL
ncbi:lipid-binding SYLF domain-containing protein [Kordiimonas aquimaris]|uniref:lipid-binding SYLF domain-containing protein n=1 Tax=Kordiimonas aquimaris TaxID=707591 RepID=UPI0021D15C5C|nr:YSC84-related protein [Kordiimonas aquimaris]